MIVNKPLFGVKKEEPKIEVVKETPLSKNNYDIIRSDKNGITSIIDFNQHTDRFKLILDNKEYACKFYQKNEDKFIGASFLGMYYLNEYFDRSIIREEE